MQIVIIGGGAAGSFAAINCAERCPGHRITILEKSSKVLVKVRVSGGGRCNVTHHCFENNILVQNYPRGEKQLLSPFSRFNPQNTVEWFAQRGVKLKTEADGRMFPESNSSQTIIDCFLEQLSKNKVNLKLNCGVKQIERKETGFDLLLENGGVIYADKVLIAVGGHVKPAAYDWLSKLGHTVVPPVPSLFTFNIPGDPVTQLMGMSVPARVRIDNTKLEHTGPLLITHWGMSGPAILKLSSVGARALHEAGYDFSISVSWLPRHNEEKMRMELDELRRNCASQKPFASKPFELPKRLWEFLLSKAGVGGEARWGDLSNKQLNRLVQALLHDNYKVKGKTTFKEEFVTCGGIKLSEVDFRTMESRLVPGLYFAGEVLDIDGITGGFNFQAAWSTAMAAASSLCS